MKRILSLFFCAAVCLFLYLPISFAESSGNLWFESAENAGGNHIVTLMFEGNNDIEMMQFEVNYDSTKLHLDSCSVGDGFTNTTAPTVNTETGKVFLVWDALEPFTGKNLLVFSFSETDGAAGSATIRINRDEEFVFADKDFNEIAVADRSLEIPLSQTQTSESGTTSVESDSIGQGENNGIELNSYSVSLKPNENYDISGSSGSQNENVIWTSGNEAVATVENGVVTAVGEGITVISAESEDGGKRSTCVVGVNLEPKNDAAAEPENAAASPAVEVETDSNAENKGREKRSVCVAAGIVIILTAIIIVLIKKKRKEKKS